jgi:hypothetical protein
MIKTTIECKNVWAVMNGWLNWFEFIEANSKINGSDIPQSIVDELIDLALSGK